MLDWAFLNWLGQTYGIWVHDYWLFYATIGVGGAVIIDIWRRIRKLERKVVS